MTKARCRRQGRRDLWPAVGAPSGSAGFTLLELVLVLGIVAMLVGVMVLSVPGLAGGRRLERQAERFATAVRLARADAANRSRRLRLTFDPETSQPTVFWEPNPLTAPGEFVDYSTVCTWRTLLEAEGILVERCTFSGPSRYRYAVDAASTDRRTVTETDLAPITFEPDGSADSAIVHLVEAEDPEGRLARIELNGVTGRVTSRVLTPEELAELETGETETVQP
jgi:general secretion pathway protein H